MILIDGSEKHGGGSIFRLAIAFSVLRKEPVKIINIRRGRPQPGLKAQHLLGLKALAELSNADVKGASLGSKEVEFYPEEIAKRKIKIQIPTAGSVALVLQPLILASVFSNHKVEVEINGGATYGKWAPPIDFLQNVTFNLLEKMGYKINLFVEKYGFYPKGGAKVKVVINPTKSLKPLTIKDQGKIKLVKGISIASNSLRKARVAERQAETFKKKMEGDVDVRYFDTLSPGSCLTAWVETGNTILGNDEVGERGVRAEIIGEKVALNLMKEIGCGATLDSFTADQLIPFLALTEGSVVKIPRMTGHVESSLWLVEKFLGKKFDINKSECVEISI
ncbi:MAG: RNA 3'-terminal phosphate cyclase [Candidatus Aenigmarchaeota archaeon]|nr:RNA 3'-terminal phosphate cyclase [Candidatus Aenigmarchaeota archaeon]